MTTPIHDFLTEYAAGDVFRCHMPGHKGDADRFGGIAGFDITEIDGADTLYDSGGIILESERNAAALFGAAETLYSCGGATLAVQAMLALAKFSGYDAVYAGRNCHAAVLRAAILLGLDVTRIDGAGDVTERLPAVVNTADYYGNVTGVAELAAYRERTPLLLADNSHGTYSVFARTCPGAGIPPHPLAIADIVADSGHKTLPVLTGGAYLHISESGVAKGITRAAAKEAMALFGSTSPSYLILNSLDLCNKFIADCGDTALRSFAEAERLKQHLRTLGYRVADNGSPLHTVLLGNACSMWSVLRESKIEPEMVGQGAVVLLFSTACADLSELTARFPPCPRDNGTDNVNGIDDVNTIADFKCEKIMPPREAYFARTEIVAVQRGAGRVCAGIYSPVPPCCPLVYPGERIDERAVTALRFCGVRQVRVVV